MAVLKRIKASSLMETLVATVLIVLIFLISSQLLNSLFANSIKQNASEARERLIELQYAYQNQQLELPYYEEIGSWELIVSKHQQADAYLVMFEARNIKSQKRLTNTIIDEGR